MKPARMHTPLMRDGAPTAKSHSGFRSFARQAHKIPPNRANRRCRGRLVEFLLPIVILVILGGTASTQEFTGPGIIGADNRIVVEDKRPIWDAIGQVNISGFRNRSLCSGTLIAADAALTAAHCVVDHSTKAPIPTGNIHFVAGVRGNTNKGHSKAKCVRFLEGYTFIPISERTNISVIARVVAKDAAVIFLENKLSVKPASLARDVVSFPGLALLHASYSGDRRFRLSAHIGCRLLATDPLDSIWINDCDTHFGSSGGPLFVAQHGALRLAAIMSSGRPRHYNFATPITNWIGLTRDKGCR
jgi:protease YdgD